MHEKRGNSCLRPLGDRCFDSAPAAAPPPPPGGDIPAGANVWARNLTGGAKAVVFFNTAAAPARVPCGAACFAAMAASSPQYKMRDLWTHSDNGTVAPAQGMSVTVGPSATVMLKLTPA
eukprot:SAG22_NODE_165_length_16780_cov_57.761525_4_plen_119_part_00